MLVRYFRRRALHKLQRELTRVRAAAREVGGLHARTDILNLDALWALQRREAALRLQIRDLKAELDSQDRPLRS